MHFVFAHRGHAQRGDTVKQFFARFQVVDVRRRRPDHAPVDIGRIVHQAAQPRMGLQLDAVGQVHRACRDIIDRGLTVVAKRQEIFFLGKQAVIGCQRCQRELHRHQIGKLYIGELVKKGALVRRRRRLRIDLHCESSLHRPRPRHRHRRGLGPMARADRPGQARWGAVVRQAGLRCARTRHRNWSAPGGWRSARGSSSPENCAPIPSQSGRRTKWWGWRRSRHSPMRKSAANRSGRSPRSSRRSPTQRPARRRCTPPCRTIDCPGSNQARLRWSSCYPSVPGTALRNHV